VDAVDQESQRRRDLLTRAFVLVVVVVDAAIDV